MARYAHITGWGMAVPERVMTNQELTQMVETTDDWIRSHTGICERHIAGPEDTTASLGVEASLKAIEVANLQPEDIDLIIVSTSSPEHIFPSTACILQDRIGATKAGAFDLSAACTGFIYALNMAAQSIRSGSINNALVVGAETLSRFVNWKDRETCILFGDGSGAFVLQGSDEPGGLLSSIIRSDGSGSELLNVPAGGSRIPASLESVNDGLHFIHMNGHEVFRFATRVMAQATREVVEAAQLKLDDIHYVIPHQANQRIIEAAIRRLEIPSDRCVINIARYGNTSTASIPIAVCEAIQDGRIHNNQNLVFVGFGAGLTWGAIAIHWTGPFPAKVKVSYKRITFWARMRSLVKRVLRRVEGLIWARD